MRETLVADDRDSIHRLTSLLENARGGATDALELLVSEVYGQLKRTAGSMVRDQAPGLTLKATDVVHEAYFRLFRGRAVEWVDRRHFFGSAANAMRQVLVEHARRKKAGKRIPREAMVSLDDQDVLEIPNLDILALHRALNKLEEVSPRQAQVVELRFFGGLSEKEVAGLLQVSRMTVTRDWRVARLRLWREIQG